MQSNINYSRIYQLMRCDIYLHRSTIITTIIAASVLLLLYNLNNPFNFSTTQVDPLGFTAILFIGGCWISSIGFRDWHKKPQAFFTLLLPATHLEKFIARWLLTSVIYAFATLLFYSCFYWIIDSMFWLVTRQNAFSFFPTSYLIWHLILKYFIVQSVLLLGSVFFQKASFLKTFLFAGFFAMVFYAVLSSINGMLIYQSINFYIWTLIIPISLIATYLRLKEIEA